MLPRFTTVVLNLWVAGVVNGNPKSDLVLEIKALADHIVVGEPIVLDVTLTNNGTGILSVCRELAQWGNHARYFVSRDSADFSLIPGLLSERHTAPVALAPGKSLRHVEWLQIDLSGSMLDARHPLFLASESGLYTFYVEYQCPVSDDIIGSIVSNRATVTVERPGEQDAVILDRLEQFFPLFETNPDEASVETLDPNSVQGLLALTEQASAYSPYAALVLAKHELAKLRAPANQKELEGLEFIDMVRVQREWADRALGRLEKADVDGFPLRAEAVRAKIEAHRFKSSLTKSGFLKYGRLRAETLALMQERYPDLWTSEVEVEQLEKRLLTEFPDSAAAWRLRKELETAAPYKAAQEP